MYAVGEVKMRFGIWELVIILLIVALVFGTKKLRGIGGDLGGAIKGFKNAIDDDSAEKTDAEKESEEQKSKEANS